MPSKNHRNQPRRQNRPNKQQNTKAKAADVVQKSSGRSFCFYFFAVIVLLVALGWMMIPQFTSYVLFANDHILGRFGFQPEGLYHCTNNRFGHETNYDNLVVEAREGKARPPPVIKAEDYTPELMKEVSQNYRLPVVISGLFSDSVAGKSWSMDYFDQKYGNQTIIHHDLEFPIDSITSSFQRQNAPTSLHDYIQNVTGGGNRVLGNDHYLLLQHTALIEELEVARWKQFDGMPILPLSLRFFMGGVDTGVGWHAATSHNLFIEVKGQKLFKWFPPQSTSLRDLHPTLSNKLPAIEHCEGHYYDGELETYEYILQDGDACFTPAWVWHATRHLEPTIAVGLRMESFLHDLRSAPFQSYLAEYSSDIPGVPFFNAFSRGMLQAFGFRIQGQALTKQEQEYGYEWDWLRDYMQAGGKLASEDLQDSQWKL